MMRYLMYMALLAPALTGAAASEGLIQAAGGTVTRDNAGRIVAVNLHASWVTDSDIAELAKLPALATLDLSETRITDRGLLDLKTAVNLTDLNLYYAELVSDQGIAVVKTLPHLKRLNLRGTKITDSTLQLINRLSALESLDIGFAQVTDSGIGQLALPDLKELSIGGNKLTDAGLQALRQMPTLTSLDLSGAQRTDSGLWSVSLTESGIDAISTLKDLRHLRLNGVAISTRGLERLKGLSKLERLDLQACPRVSDDAMAFLVSLPALRVLDVTASAITAETVSKLRKAKPGLQVIATGFRPGDPAMPNGPAN
jgi:Leucine-rich repeat (LRR) protein